MLFNFLKLFLLPGTSEGTGCSIEGVQQTQPQPQPQQQKPGQQHQHQCPPAGQQTPGLQSMTIYLNRHTGLDRTCRVRFNIRVGGSGSGPQADNDDDESRSNHGGTESGIRDEFSDVDGRSLGWLPRIKFSDCVVRGIFRVLVDMMSVNTVSYSSRLIKDIL